MEKGDTRLPPAKSANGTSWQSRLGECSTSRRDVLNGGFLAGAGLLMSGVSPIALPAMPTSTARSEGLPGWGEAQDSAVNLRHLVRMQGSLREQDVPWWFTGVIFAVPSSQESPRPLVRFEGLETYWFSHTDHGFRLGGHTVTFFRDYETNRFLYEYANPWTGQTDEVTAAVQGGNLEFEYSRDGIWPVRLDGTPFSAPERSGLRVQWEEQGPHVWLQHQTVYPPRLPGMFGQRQSMFVRRDEFFDDKIEALPSVFSSTVFMGWLKWMRMRDYPGHVIWHASGAKLKSLADVPTEFLGRAEREHPDRLTAKPQEVT